MSLRPRLLPLTLREVPEPSPEDFAGTRIPDGEAWDALARRLGPERLHQRLVREKHLEMIAARARYPDGRRGDRTTSARLLETFFLLTGLRSRGRRNFRTIRRREVRWAFPDLPAELEGYRILHLSDLHLDLDPGVGARAAAAIQGLDHDLAVFTGDLNDLAVRRADMRDDALPPLRAALSGTPVAIPGNHDSTETLFLLEEHGFRVLVNEGIEPRPGLQVFGTDDDRLYRGADLGAFHPRNDAFRLLLAHSPQTIARVPEGHFHLALCGHTHGGQICFPGGRPLVRPFSCPSDLLSGPWRHGSLRGYTSNGIGGGKVTLRFNAPPEVVVHLLTRGVGDPGVHEVPAVE